MKIREYVQCDAFDTSTLICVAVESHQTILIINNSLILGIQTSVLKLYFTYFKK